MTAIFITATGTDVGKTYVAASLIRLFRQMGRTVDAIKPVVSGFDPAAAATSDPGILLEALGLPPTADEIQRISPWRFRAPLSPDLAARREGRAIDVDQVIAFCRSAVERRADLLLIEGVGGVMVPLDGQRTILDVMMALRLPLILVTGSYLGAISHTLTAVELAVPARHESARHHRQRDGGLNGAARRRGRDHCALRRARHRLAAVAFARSPLKPGRAFRPAAQGPLTGPIPDSSQSSCCNKA